MDNIKSTEKTIRNAMDINRIIEFSYYGAQASRLAPFAIVTNRLGQLEVHGRYYQNTRKHDAIFQLSRMTDIKITTQVFQPPKTFDRAKADRNPNVKYRAKTSAEKEEDQASITDIL